MITTQDVGRYYVTKKDFGTDKKGDRVQIDHVTTDLHIMEVDPELDDGTSEIEYWNLRTHEVHIVNELVFEEHYEEERA